MHIPAYIVARIFVLAYGFGFAALAGFTSKGRMSVAECIIAGYFLTVGAVVEYRLFHFYVGTFVAVAAIIALAAVGAVFGRFLASRRARRVNPADPRTASDK